MSDKTILHHITELVDEENRLRTESAETHAARIKQLEVELDQCWDLLRQRRAKAEFGDKPSDATLRDAKTVEGYEN
ncbi:DUF2630 family protein [soil metagenome]